MIFKRVLKLPDARNKFIKSTFDIDPNTLLAKLSLEHMAMNPDLSGVSPLKSGYDAFCSRLELAKSAERSIDAQYYIWRNDVSGMLLITELYYAALRGVRVRLLLDDNGISGLDSTLAFLNSLENFEIRLFNPSKIRHFKFISYLFDFSRMNRRMHNKSYIVDGVVAIVGGRNIGDEYFGINNANYFIDLDVLAIGNVVGDTSTSFDLYWNSASALEVERIIKNASDLNEFLKRVSEVKLHSLALSFSEYTGSQAILFQKKDIKFELTTVKLIADPPDKMHASTLSQGSMVSQLSDVLGEIYSNLDLTSAYFVPGREGVAFLKEKAQKKNKIRVLTNAMSTTDVLLVHAGYAKYRHTLLKGGVELYELKSNANQLVMDNKHKKLGVSGTALHAKTFSIDNEKVFVGSFNFDPRSAHLNCEMGYLIYSPNLAIKAKQEFNIILNFSAYQLHLDKNDKIFWRENISSDCYKIHTLEPGARFLKRLSIFLIGLLPIEWLL